MPFLDQLEHCFRIVITKYPKFKNINFNYLLLLMINDLLSNLRKSNETIAKVNKLLYDVDEKIYLYYTGFINAHKDEVNSIMSKFFLTSLTDANKTFKFDGIERNLQLSAKMMEYFSSCKNNSKNQAFIEVCDMIGAQFDSFLEDFCARSFYETNELKAIVKELYKNSSELELQESFINIFGFDEINLVHFLIENSSKLKQFFSPAPKIQSNFIFDSRELSSGANQLGISLPKNAEFSIDDTKKIQTLTIPSNFDDSFKSSFSKINICDLNSPVIR